MDLETYGASFAIYDLWNTPGKLYLLLFLNNFTIHSLSILCVQKYIFNGSLQFMTLIAGPQSGYLSIGVIIEMSSLLHR